MLEIYGEQTGNGQQALSSGETWLVLPERKSYRDSGRPSPNTEQTLVMRIDQIAGVGGSTDDRGAPGHFWLRSARTLHAKSLKLRRAAGVRADGRFLLQRFYAPAWRWAIPARRLSTAGVIKNPVVQQGVFHEKGKSKPRNHGVACFNELVVLTFNALRRGTTHGHRRSPHVRALTFT